MSANGWEIPLESLISPGRDTNAREDTIPHERGLLPMLPSDFCCNAIADPKARFAARRLPNDIRHQETHLSR